MLLYGHGAFLSARVRVDSVNFRRVIASFSLPGGCTLNWDESVFAEHPDTYGLVVITI